MSALPFAHTLGSKYLQNCVVILLLALFSRPAISQTVAEHPTFSRLNNFGIFGEYSNDSSPIVLGGSRQRKLAGLGFSYSRRLFEKKQIGLAYLAEFRPVLFESDPVFHETATYSVPPTSFTSVFRLPRDCRPSVVTVGSAQGQSATFNVKCGREWIYSHALSPVGFEINLFPRRRLQPVLTGLGGYALFTQPVPIENAGSFNFTFSVGTGFELYLSREKSRRLLGNPSIRVEYRYHHISNANTADANPGIDSGIFHMGYFFGR